MVTTVDLALFITAQAPVTIVTTGEAGVVMVVAIVIAHTIAGVLQFNVLDVAGKLEYKKGGHLVHLFYWKNFVNIHYVHQKDSFGAS